MAITQALANSFKKEFLEADHDFTQTTGDKFKIVITFQKLFFEAVRDRL